MDGGKHIPVVILSLNIFLMVSHYWNTHWPISNIVNVYLSSFWKGLFHPARKVRDVYWKIYNSIYIGSQDALIAHYPRIFNDDKNTHVRYELDYIL